MKRIISYIIMFALAATVVSFGVIYAGNEQDQLNDVNDQLSKTHSQLTAGKKKERQLDSQIRQLELQINATEAEIDKLSGNIGKTEQEIDVVKQNLEAAKQDMENQDKSLQERLRAMYKNGDVSMIQILLGSDNITDFMSNMDMVQKIFDNDAQILKTLQEQHDKIAKQKQDLESLQARLVSQKQDQSDKQTSLEASQGKVETLKAQVASDNAALEAQEDTLKKEADRLVAEIRKLQGSQAYAGGTFCWPSAGSHEITSPFGMRYHPILKVNKMHTGIDIRAASGTKVLAANSGTVIKAGWNNSYGNVVMVDHGGGIVTLYAHNSKLLVASGDVVSRGQNIALSGSTGMSTGPHIHFEVRVNGEYKDPMGWFK